jgi:hypothetical protein
LQNENRRGGHHGRCAGYFWLAMHAHRYANIGLYRVFVGYFAERKGGVSKATHKSMWQDRKKLWQKKARNEQTLFKGDLLCVKS